MKKNIEKNNLTERKNPMKNNVVKSNATNQSLQVIAYNSYPYYQTFEIRINNAKEPIFYHVSPLLPQTVNYNGLKDVIKLYIDGFDGVSGATYIEHDSQTKFCALFNHLILSNTCNSSFMAKFDSFTKNSSRVISEKSYVIDISSDDNGIMHQIIIPSEGSYTRNCEKDPFSDEHLSDLIELIQEIDKRQPENNLEVFGKDKKSLNIKKYKSRIDNSILCSVNIDHSKYNFFLNKNTDIHTNEEIFLSYLRKILTGELNIKDGILSFDKRTFQCNNDLTTKLIFAYDISSIWCYPDYPQKNKDNKNDNLIIAFYHTSDEDYEVLKEIDTSDYKLECSLNLSYEDINGDGKMCIYRTKEIYGHSVEYYALVDNSINEILQLIKTKDRRIRDCRIR